MRGKVERIGAVPVKYVGKMRVNSIDRSAIAAKRIGKCIVNLFVNEDGLYVYTPKQRMICLSRGYHRDSMLNVIYIWEDD